MSKDYERLPFTNNFMFCKIMQSDPELCKEITEAILDVKIREIVRIGNEEGIEISEDGHGVRFDVYLEDSDDTIYDIEMQAANTRDLIKRSRYYQGMIDLNTLDKGDDYNKLRKTYIIFICTFDVFGRGLGKYTLKKSCVEDASIDVNDDSITVFVNTGGILNGASPAMNDLVKYISTGVVYGDLSKKIDGALEKARMNKEWMVNYMTFEWELAKVRREGVAEGMAEGMAKGRTEGRIEGQIELIKTILKHTSPEEAMSLGISEKDIEKALAES